LVLEGLDEDPMEQQSGGGVHRGHTRKIVLAINAHATPGEHWLNFPPNYPTRAGHRLVGNISVDRLSLN
jgi:hypothetical protein